jgi:predicted Zn-dependent peptidase
MKMLIAVVMAMAGLAVTQDERSFDGHVTQKVLENGLSVIICERPEAPVFSFFLRVDVGSDQDPTDAAGLAHMFEHMAFKGTDKVGTSNYAAEQQTIEQIESAYQAYNAERTRSPGSSNKTLQTLETAWKNSMAAAQKYVIENEFGHIVEQAGGVGLNASTSVDETDYHYSLPSNEFELWAYLESERFLHPVFREFYQEREVVQEERRVIESQPSRRLQEQFLAAAFVAHPYGKPPGGWPSDLDFLSITDAEQFYRKHYVPSNMVIALVGDLRALEVWPIIEKYFGRLPANAKPSSLHTLEPPQRAERVVILHEASQPIFVEGYHRPSAKNRDDVVYAVLRELISSGRTSRLYRALVRDKRIAASAGGYASLPGKKYPSLFVLFAVPTLNHTPEEVRDAIHIEIERVKHTDVTDSELAMVKTRLKADLLRSLEDNESLAYGLANAVALYGDWRALFRRVDEIEKVSKADVRRVANDTFIDENRTIAMIESTPAQSH